LAELLALVRDFTALNLLLTEGTTLWALCLYTQDPDYYTLHWRQGDGEVVVASQPVDDQPGWAPLATGTLLRVGPDLAVSTEGLVPPA
jgi:glutamine amidotransferase